MDILFGVVIGLLGLMILVVIHELGHFFAARWNGVEVEEFGIGFVPRAVAWRKVDGKWRKIPKEEWGKPGGEGLVLSLNYLPIGGFCKMKGETDADEKKGGFGRASLGGKTKVLFGGVVANLLAAAVIFMVLAWTGMPHFVEGQFSLKSDTRVEAEPVVIAEVKEGSPAARAARIGGEWALEEGAGLEAGDRIVEMRARCCDPDEHEKPGRDDGVRVLVTKDVISFNETYAGEEIYIGVVRDGEEVAYRVQLNEAEDEYLLGVVMEQKGVPLYYSTWSAPVVGVVTTVQLTGETMYGVGQMLWGLFSGLAMQLSLTEEVREAGAASLGKVGDSVSGPIGIIGMIFPAFASTGWTNLMFLIAIISVSLAVMNILPIPALDGGRWLLIMIYRLRRKKLTREIEEKIVGRAFMVLIGLIVVIAVLDVARFFR